MKTKYKTLRNIIYANLICTPVFASDLIITPEINAEMTRTNHVDGPGPKEESSLVTQIKPSLNVFYDSSLVNFNIDVSKTFFNYSHDNEENGSINDLMTIGTFRISDTGLKVEVSSHIFNRSQSNPDKTLLSFDLSDNVQVEQYNAGFRFNKNNTFYKINSSLMANKTISEDNIGEKSGYDFVFKGKSGISSKNIFWTAKGRLSDYEQKSNIEEYSKIYDAEVIVGLITNFNVNPFIRGYTEDAVGTISHADMESFKSVGLGFNFTPIPSVGVYMAYNTVLGDTDKEDYGSIDLEWNPSDNTSLDLSYGKRFFGNAYELTFKNQSNRLNNKFTYLESLNAFDRFGFERVMLGYFLCPDHVATINQCTIQPDADGSSGNLISFTTINPVQNKEYVLSKEAEWTATLALRKTTFTLYSQVVTRDYMTSKIEDIEYNIRFDVKRELNQVSNLTIGLEYQNSTYDKKKISNAFHSSSYAKEYLSYHRDINSTSSVDVDLQYRDTKSTRQEHNYKEARLSISYTKKF